MAYRERGCKWILVHRLGQIPTRECYENARRQRNKTDEKVTEKDVQKMKVEPDKQVNQYLKEVEGMNELASKLKSH